MSLTDTLAKFHEIYFIYSFVSAEHSKHCFLREKKISGWGGGGGVDVRVL